MAVDPPEDPGQLHRLLPAHLLKSLATRMLFPTGPGMPRSLLLSLVFWLAEVIFVMAWCPTIGCGPCRKPRTP